jgi:hypothetical protein
MSVPNEVTGMTIVPGNGVGVGIGVSVGTSVGWMVGVLVGRAVGAMVLVGTTVGCSKPTSNVRLQLVVKRIVRIRPKDRQNFMRSPYKICHIPIVRHEYYTGITGLLRFCDEGK